MAPETYVNAWLANPVLEIEDWVDKWLASGLKMPVYDFLGVTRAEYALYVRYPDALPYILREYKLAFDWKWLALSKF